VGIDDPAGTTGLHVVVDSVLEHAGHALEPLPPDRVFIAGRQQPESRRSTRRLRRYRTGAEGQISHLKRRYGVDRSRLKGDEGQQIWTEWAILAYNADTLAVRTR
jgi:IS5 family transposase